jgi:hypothetical protein
MHTLTCSLVDATLAGGWLGVGVLGNRFQHGWYPLQITVIPDRVPSKGTSVHAAGS